MPTDVFTASGTWNRPAGVTSVLVDLWAGGAGGTSGNIFGGAPGGGAGALSSKVVDVSTDATWSIRFIGAAGAGGTGGTGNQGTAGADSWFSPDTLGNTVDP